MKIKFYKQISGVPMGAHFAPSFAIIFMNYVEETALRKLNFTPVVYKRFIDDIILGPVEHSDTIMTHILGTFNSVNSNILFTLEVQIEPKRSKSMVTVP